MILLCSSVMNNVVLLWEFALSLEALITLNQQRAAGDFHQPAKRCKFDS